MTTKHLTKVELEPWNGLPISDGIIDCWIREALHTLKERIVASEENWYSHVTLSGDSLVVVQGWIDVEGRMHAYVYRTFIVGYKYVAVNKGASL
jgi:hypothetical protein